MVSVKVYVEGGGDHNRTLAIQCRKGFAMFFERAGFKGRMPAVVACGGRQQALKDFCTALKSANSATFPVMLVDSEGPVRSDAWAHLRDQDKWTRPTGARDDQAHLMVQCMENWFLADRAALADYFGQGFSEAALPPASDPESVDKPTLLEALKKATRQAKSKGEYNKGRHSFDILARLDANAVIESAPHAKRLVDTLNSKLTR